MAITQQPPINMASKGAVGMNFLHLGGGVWIFHAATTPTDGTSGDGAGWAAKGSIYIDTNAGEIYTQQGTTASPSWVNQT